MARKKAAQATVTGEVVSSKLSEVKPNSWNPNKMTERVYESVVQGFKEDGWLASQALLIWRTDENGNPQNVIIDGEHRWKVAQELGIQEGPMVFLDNLPLHKAKALTIKLDNKRGSFDTAALQLIVTDIISTYDSSEALALDLGFEDDALASIIEHESGSFLDSFGNDDAPPAPNEVPPKPVSDGYVTFSVKCTPEQNDIIHNTIRLAKKAGARSTMDALIDICRAYKSED